MSEPASGSEVGFAPMPGRWVALLLCCSALFMTLLDVSVTNVALPSIGRATGAGPSQLQWVISGYTLAFGLVPVLAGRLGDDHGRRRMFRVGVAGFLLTSACAGLTPTSTLLIVARVLQGLFGGLINPQVSGLVQQLFRGSERGRAFGVLGTTVGVGTALGPIVGGGLIELGGPHLGWRLVFFINVPIGLTILALSRRLLPEDPARGKHRLDVLGSLVLGTATFCVLFAAVEYDSLHDARLAWLGVPAVVLLGLFWRRERRLTRDRADPLVDLRLFRQPSYTAGVVLALAYFPAMAGLPLVMALYYQYGLGFSAIHSALGVTAYALGNAVAAPLAGRVVTRVGRPLVVGAALTFGLGAVALALVARSGPQWPGQPRRLGDGRSAVRDGLRQRRPDHPQPDADADARGPRRREYGGRRAADLPADRPGDRPGRHRRRLLRIGRRHRPAGLRPRGGDGRAGGPRLRGRCGGRGDGRPRPGPAPRGAVKRHHRGRPVSDRPTRATRASPTPTPTTSATTSCQSPSRWIGSTACSTSLTTA
ncbi:MFS transporter [Nocardioides terrisoli]|uniref:MFS transporter n=1 Tax=Nocardioides terrisoli TaxID=3388267 RepID=UPI00287B9067|nr:MFS transporter [Nocardioides marmorisolisilvae]